MRASDEHLLSVRVPRAGGRPGYPPLPTCSSTVQPVHWCHRDPAWSEQSCPIVYQL